MPINLNILKSDHGILKLVELGLVLTTFLLVRIGVDGTTAIYGGGEDGLWLGHVTVGGFIIIMPVTVMGLVLGDQVPWRMEVMFSMVGGVLFCTVGGLTINDYHDMGDSKVRDVGLAVGSLAIITGVILLADATVIGGKYRKYLNI